MCRYTPRDLGTTGCTRCLAATTSTSTRAVCTMDSMTYEHRSCSPPALLVLVLTVSIMIPEMSSSGYLIMGSWLDPPHPTSHPEIQEMWYYTSTTCSGILVTCTRLPACCVLCISWYWAQAQQGRARWCPSAPGYPSCHPRCHPSDVSSGGHGWTHGSDLSS